MRIVSDGREVRSDDWCPSVLEFVRHVYLGVGNYFEARLKERTRLRLDNVKMHEEPRCPSLSGFPDFKRNSIKGESYNVYQISIPMFSSPLFRACRFR